MPFLGDCIFCLLAYVTRQIERCHIDCNVCDYNVYTTQSEAEYMFRKIIMFHNISCTTSYYGIVSHNHHRHHELCESAFSLELGDGGSTATAAAPILEKMDPPRVHCMYVV